MVGHYSLPYVPFLHSDRKKLRTQTEEKGFALNSLRMRQKDLADVQRHLQADLLRCSQVCGKEKGPQYLAPRKGGLKEEFFHLRTSLHSVLEKEAGRDDPGRQDWVQVLDEIKDWEKRAEKQVRLHVNNGQSIHIGIFCSRHSCSD